jgi:hypothetical protein
MQGLRRQLGHMNYRALVLRFMACADITRSRLSWAESLRRR